MRRRMFLFIVMLFGLLVHSFAQQKVAGIVKGKLVDTTYKESMADATISVVHANDSSLISYTRSNEKGEFQIKNLPAGSYRMVISFQGYEQVTRRVTISASSTQVDVGVINMEKTSITMAEVKIERPPIIIKKDTVEFAASAFKTKPNAIAEDLLKKLPGVEVDKDGNIKAQGENIQKVYVNGKEFFGNDPKIATKNLTADMIDAVQVFDDMSEQSKFTKIDDGSRSKAINIKLKRNMNQGYMGRITVGYGTDDRYTTNVMLNSFQNTRRISVIGSSSNFNGQGFNFKDIVGSIGGRGGGFGRRGGFSGGSNGGITTSTLGGINYVDNIGHKLQLTSSYFYGGTKNYTEGSSLRQTSFLAKDSISYQSEENFSNSTNRNHTINLRLQYDIDSMNSLIYTPNLTLQRSNDFSSDTTSTSVTYKGVNYLALSGANQNTNSRKGTTFNNELLYRHRFHKFGRTFTLGWKGGISSSDGNGTTYAPLTFYNPSTGIVDSTRIQDFISTQETRSNSNVVSSSYTEPIGINKIIELNYAYTNNVNTSDRKGVSYNSITGQYDSLNAQQTNYFKNIFLAHRFGVSFRYQGKLYTFQLGAAMQNSKLDNSSTQAIYRVNGKDSTIVTKQTYTNFFPTASFAYNFRRRKNIYINYQGRTSQPTVKQLQDVRDETDVLRTIVGNPNLKQEFSNNISVNYTSLNEETFRYLNINFFLGQTANKIVNSINQDTVRGTGVQLIKPINLNGIYNTSYSANLGIPLRNEYLKGSSLNFTNSATYSRDVSNLYGQNNVTNNFSISQSAGITLAVREKLNIGFTGMFSYNVVKYSLQEGQSQNLNTEYFSQNYSLDINYFTLQNLYISTNFDYSLNSGLSAGYNQSVPLWSSGVAYQVFKKKNGEIKLSVNDILNQNRSINRQIIDNEIIDTRTMVVKRYFLLTFTYNFNSFGKYRSKQEDTRINRPEQIMMRNQGRMGGFK